MPRSLLQGGCGVCWNLCEMQELSAGRWQATERCSQLQLHRRNARPLYTRAKQHLASYRSHLTGRWPIESWMWDHTVSHHNSQMGPDQGAADYAFRIQGTFRKPLTRQVDEAVRLGQIDSHGKVLDEGGEHVISLNSRGEFYRPSPSLLFRKFLIIFLIFDFPYG